MLRVTTEDKRGGVSTNTRRVCDLPTFLPHYDPRRNEVGQGNPIGEIQGKCASVRTWSKKELEAEMTPSWYVM